mmetsp:Transcript_19191/g.36166  ORF Transcript_19191/g.36166 Transcript_19191/m.36166 type:complete len:1026 (-) Transcript_19191:170-3247(-)
MTGIGAANDGDAFAGARDLEWIRHQCALKLQHKLLDPQARAEKAPPAALPRRQLTHDFNCAAAGALHDAVAGLVGNLAAGRARPPADHATSDSSSGLVIDSAVDSMPSSAGSTPANVSHQLRRHPAVPPLPLQTAGLTQPHPHAQGTVKKPRTSSAGAGDRPSASPAPQLAVRARSAAGQRERAQVPSFMSPTAASCSKVMASAPSTSISSVHVEKPRFSTSGGSRPTFHEVGSLESAVPAQQGGGIRPQRTRPTSPAAAAAAAAADAVRSRPRTASPGHARNAGTSPNASRRTSPLRSGPRAEASAPTSRTGSQGRSRPSGAGKVSRPHSPALQDAAPRRSDVRRASPGRAEDAAPRRGEVRKSSPSNAEARLQARRAAPRAASATGAARGEVAGQAAPPPKGGMDVCANLHQAALALRRIVPAQERKQPAPMGRQVAATRSPQRARREGTADAARVSDTAEASAENKLLSNSLSSPPLRPQSRPGNARAGRPPAIQAPAPQDSSSEDPSLAPLVEKLMQENATLREDFNEQQRRLAKLEDEKWGFPHEGIYDLVNAMSVAGTQSGTPNLRNYEELLSRLSNGTTAVSATRTPTSPQGTSFLDTPATPGKSCTTGSPISRREEEDRRSAELNDENMRLRRELARASEVGEALEQQHRAAEDRAHALEQERAWLRERLEGIEATSFTSASMAVDPSIGPGALGQGVADGPGVRRPEPSGLRRATSMEVRQQVEEMSLALRAELQEEAAEATPGPGSECFGALPSQAQTPKTPARSPNKEWLEAEIEADRARLAAERAELDAEQARAKLQIDKLATAKDEHGSRESSAAPGETTASSAPRETTGSSAPSSSPLENVRMNRPDDIGEISSDTPISPQEQISEVLHGTLVVCPRAGFDLHNADSGILGDVSDPYVVCRVGDSEQKTQTIKNNLNPVWKDEEFRFQVHASSPSNKVLRLQVMDENHFHADACLGSLEIDIETLARGETSRIRRRLKDIDKGEVELEICFKPEQAAEQEELVPIDLEDTW